MNQSPTPIGRLNWSRLLDVDLISQVENPRLPRYWKETGLLDLLIVLCTKLNMESWVSYFITEITVWYIYIYMQYAFSEFIYFTVMFLCIVNFYTGFRFSKYKSIWQRNYTPPCTIFRIKLFTIWSFCIKYICKTKLFYTCRFVTDYLWSVWCILILHDRLAFRNIP